MGFQEVTILIIKKKNTLVNPWIPNNSKKRKDRKTHLSLFETATKTTSYFENWQLKETS